jgi:uncharacterized protein with ParB-like and HNH nuclease domain
MKTIVEIRNSFDLDPKPLTSRIKYFKTKTIDWDIYLPTRGRNLQRNYVWSIEQKRELIWSVLIRRHIPPCAIINTIDKEDESKDIYLIIDGKQRLSTIFDFIDDKFTIIIENIEYLYSELPVDYQQEIANYNFHYYIINEPWDNRITDDQKITWFKFINFAGTQQEKDHLKSLL